MLGFAISKYHNLSNGPCFHNIENSHICGNSSHFIGFRKILKKSPNLFPLEISMSIKNMCGIFMLTGKSSLPKQVQCLGPCELTNNKLIGEKFFLPLWEHSVTQNRQKKGFIYRFNKRGDGGQNFSGKVSNNLRPFHPGANPGFFQKFL